MEITPIRLLSCVIIGVCALALVQSCEIKSWSLSEFAEVSFLFTALIGVKK